MYFWKTAALKRELAAAPLSPREGFKYLLCTVVAYEVLVESTAREAVPATMWYLCFSLASIAIVVVGTIAAYAANGGDRGRDFLGRFLSLHWVLGLRFAALLTLCLAAAIIAVFALDPALLDQDEPINSIITAIGLPTGAAFYWRLAVHLRDVAQADAVPPAAVAADSR